MGLETPAVASGDSAAGTTPWVAPDPVAAEASRRQRLPGGGQLPLWGTTVDQMADDVGAETAAYLWLVRGMATVLAVATILAVPLFVLFKGQGVLPSWLIDAVHISTLSIANVGALNVPRDSLGNTTTIILGNRLSAQQVTAWLVGTDLAICVFLLAGVAFLSWRVHHFLRRASQRKAHLRDYTVWVTWLPAAVSEDSVSLLIQAAVRQAVAAQTGCCCCRRRTQVVAAPLTHEQPPVVHQVSIMWQWTGVSRFMRAVRAAQQVLAATAEVGFQRMGGSEAAARSKVAAAEARLSEVCDAVVREPVERGDAHGAFVVLHDAKNVDQLMSERCCCATCGFRCVPGTPRRCAMFRVATAPHPSEVHWHAAGVAHGARTIRVAGSWLSALVVLFVVWWATGIIRAVQRTTSDLVPAVLPDFCRVKLGMRAFNASFFVAGLRRVPLDARLEVPNDGGACTARGLTRMRWVTSTGLQPITRPLHPDPCLDECLDPQFQRRCVEFVATQSGNLRLLSLYEAMMVCYCSDSVGDAPSGASTPLGRLVPIRPAPVCNELRAQSVTLVALGLAAGAGLAVFVFGMKRCVRAVAARNHPLHASANEAFRMQVRCDGAVGTGRAS
jgi:hypothetical protein